VKYYPFVRTCRDAAFNLLPVDQQYRRSSTDFWDSGIEGKIKRTYCSGKFCCKIKVFHAIEK